MSVNVSRVGEEEGGKREKWKLGGLCGLKNRTHTSPPASRAAKTDRLIFFPLFFFFCLSRNEKEREPAKEEDTYGKNFWVLMLKPPKCKRRHFSGERTI